MNKTLKYTIYGVGGLAGLLLLGLAVLAVTFNPNDYKPLIVKLVKEKKGRTLNIEGDIKLAFWPKLGADLGRVSLSDHQAESQFASMESAKVFVAVMPLLKKQLVVDTVRIDGIRANIVRFKDGSTNFDDLLSKEESEEIRFDIDGVMISHGALNLKDEIGGRTFSISNANIRAGHIAKNEPIELDAQFKLQGNNPLINADAKFKGVLLANAAQQQFGAKDMDLALQGDVATLKGLDLKLSGAFNAKPQAMFFVADKLRLVARANMQGKNLDFLLEAPQLSLQQDQLSGKEARLSLTQTQGDDSFTAKLALADIKGSPKTFQSSGVSGEFSGKQGARTLSGTFSSPFSGNLDAMVFVLPRLAGRVDVKDPALPNGAMQSSFNVNARADVKQQQASAQLNANIDGSKLNGRLAVAGFAKPSFKFELNADVLDLNRILGQQQKPKAAASQLQPANWSVLQNLLAEGRLNVGSIIYGKYHVANLALALKADGETFSLNPLSARFDDSQIRGSVGIRHFDKPLYSFDLDIDKLDADRYLPPPSTNTAASSAAQAPDLSVLKAVNATGSLRIGNLKYGKIQASNIRIDLKGDGEKLDINPFSAKIDDSQVKAVLGVTRFQDPRFSFDMDIDRLDADRYITRPAPAAQPQQDAAIDLSALKALNASGEARLGWLKLANIKSENVRLGVKAAGGLVTLSPFSANLYQGSMNGSLSVDARNAAAITCRQEIKGAAVGPLLVDAINNDMLEGRGTVNLDVNTQGNTVAALKKALNGTATFNLADGAIKGVDIAGTVRDIKNKFSFKSNILGADQKKRTDFSEMLASFNIRNGVAHNEDLSIKAPLLRITGSGDIDIGNATLNYVAKPTVVASLKGQGGTDLDQLNGLTFPLKLTGSFAAPKYGLDFSAIATEIAKKGYLEKVGGSKGGAVQKLISGDQAGAMEDLLTGKDKRNVTADADKAVSVPASQETPKPASPEDKVKKKLNKLLGF